jgi:copper chaperone
LTGIIEASDTVGSSPKENSMPEFHVEGMSCAHCVNAVTTAIHALDPAAGVDVDLGTKRVHVRLRSRPLPAAQALVDAGYDPLPVGLESSDNL